MDNIKDLMTGQQNITEVVEFNTVEDNSESFDSLESELEITPETVQPTIGIVVDCPRLNVRMKPRADSAVICIIERDSKVMIDEENSTVNFYKICTEVGVEGYCMKQFITILG